MNVVNTTSPSRFIYFSDQRKDKIISINFENILILK